MPDPTRLVVGPGEPDNIEFGEILDRYRVEAQLSRAEAAAKLEVSSEYLRLIERGKRTPALGTMPKILTIYDVPYQMEPDKIIFERYSVEFTSRIREARYKKIENQEVRYKEVENPGRDARIGQIVRLMTTADDDTLHDIYRRLSRV